MNKYLERQIIKCSVCNETGRVIIDPYGCGITDVTQTCWKCHGKCKVLESHEERANRLAMMIKYSLTESIRCICPECHSEHTIRCHGIKVCVYNAIKESFNKVEKDRKENKKTND